MPTPRTRDRQAQAPRPRRRVDDGMAIPVDRPHEAGVDPPISEQEQIDCLKWARRASDTDLRMRYKRHWEQLERSAVFCDLLRWESVRRIGQTVGKRRTR